MTDERERAFKAICEGSISFLLNMNDTFGFATADCEEMDIDDFEMMIPIIAKYGHAALTAYVAIKRSEEPIICACNHRSPEYYAAKREIWELKKKEPYFLVSEGQEV